MADELPPKDDNAPKPDLSEIFDINRHKAVNDFVARFEELFRQADAVRNDIKELSDEAQEAMFGPDDIKAMKTVAKINKDNGKLAAAASLAALRRVSNATKLDLFIWSDEQKA